MMMMMMMMMMMPSYHNHLDTQIRVYNGSRDWSIDYRWRMRWTINRSKLDEKRPGQKCHGSGETQ